MLDLSRLWRDRGQPPRPPDRRPGGLPPRRGGGAMPPRPVRTAAFWAVLLILTIIIIQFYYTNRDRRELITYTQFIEQVTAGNLKRATIIEKEVSGEFAGETALVLEGGRSANVRNFKVYLPAEDATLSKTIWETNPKAAIDSRPPRTAWSSYLFTWFPIILFVGLWLFLIRQMQSGGSTALKFGKSRAKILLESSPKITFKDVAGADEAKQELQEIIEFLKEPKKFQTLGGRIPKGALLLGPPGTGKTLLARAVAGEASVPFFSMSGSDFVEMFVGVGASRVRDLFEQGKRNAPCIIFIDEIDAVGRHRGAGLGGGHDEREQTLNQLLVEMDGFESNDGVILLAATNRPDVLDPALLRPGRFDRQIVVDRPDARGREGILRVHTRNIPLAEDVDLMILARGTPGLAGAELANLANEAALLAARRNKKRVTMQDFEDAKDKVMMGMERRILITDAEKRSTAYHESGHALVAAKLPLVDPIHKMTVIPRGRALGVTHFLPADERYTHSREYLSQTLASIMGGRAAEELVFGQITNGAANDIHTATEVARKMVCEWGMSERLGPIQFGKREEMIFLGREIAQHKDYSEQTAILIDEEIRGLVEGAHQKALQILREGMDTLHALAEALLEREILDGEEIGKIIAGEMLEPFRRESSGDGAAPAPPKEGARNPGGVPAPGAPPNA